MSASHCILALRLVCLIQASDNDWGVSLPGSAAGLEGESVILKCSFKHPDPPNAQYNIIGKWFKGSPCNNKAKLVYKSSQPQKYNRIKLTGNLKNKNCSTEINNLNKADSGDYCFRFEIQRFRSWTGKHPINVVVYGRPGNPSVLPSEVTEGISTTLSCSSSNIDDQVRAKLTWEGITELTKQETVTEEKQSVSNRVLTSSFTFMPSYRDHLKLIKCVVSSPNYQYSKQGNITLQIKYAPQNTRVHINGSLEIIEGTENMTLTCDTDSYPQATYTWYKTKRDTNTTETLKSTDRVLLFRTISRKISGTFTCAVNNSKGNDTFAVDINVKYGPSEVNIRHDGLSYNCVADANPPANIIWKLTESKTNITTQIDDTKSMSSLAMHKLEGLCVSCQAENKYGRAHSEAYCKTKPNQSQPGKFMLITVGVNLVLVLLLTVVLAFCIKQRNQIKQLNGDSQVMKVHKFPNSIQDDQLIEEDNKHKEKCNYENVMGTSAPTKEEPGDNCLDDFKPEHSKAVDPDEDESIYSNIKPKARCGGAEPEEECTQPAVNASQNADEDSEACLVYAAIQFTKQAEALKPAEDDSEQIIYSTLRVK